MRPRAQRVHERGGVGRGAAPGVDVERALAHGRELARADGAARGLGERQQVDDDVGLGQQGRQLVDAVDPVARAAGDADHLAVEGAEHRRERPPDRAEAEDEHAQVRGVAELDQLPVPARLLLGALAGALGVGQDRGHHPLGHRAVARPARAAQRHASGNAVGDPVDAGRQQPARRAAPGISSSAGRSSQRGTTNSTSGAGSSTTSTPGGGGPSALAVVGPGLHAAGSTRGRAARRRSRRSATSASSRLRSSARSAAAMASEMRSVRASACA